MRLKQTYAYQHHNISNCDCERQYCADHRLLWRTCESENLDCPACNREWDTKHEMELQKKDQLRRATWN